jgi:hypothetical protein
VSLEDSAEDVAGPPHPTVRKGGRDADIEPLFVERGLKAAPAGKR